MLKDTKIVKRIENVHVKIPIDRYFHHRKGKDRYRNFNKKEWMSPKTTILSVSVVEKK